PTLVLRKAGEKIGREAFSYRQRGATDELEPAPNPIPGRDTIELRIKDPTEPDARKWHVLEFGAPELLKESALAHFSLVNAYLEKSRKALAMRQANLGLIVEPIIAGLNIGGGLAGVGFPIGAAARLGYNALLAPRFIPDVPSVRQMRELFRLLTARSKNPQLKIKPGEFLNRDDLKMLQEQLKEVTDAEVAEFLDRISDDDIKGMLQLAKMQRIDARLTNLLSIIASAGLVSGWTEQTGFQQTIFNNIYFSVTGEISMNYIIASLAGKKVTTPLSGNSLQELSRGDGPAAAWLQYFNATVDVRAVLNTLVRLTHRELADKELKKPFPYAPRMSDLAAYEFRVFGFPLLIFYKRGLIRADIEAYDNDYAYGLLGVKIVEHFPTREAFEAEIRAGQVVPLGYVRVRTIKGGWVETDLAVFAHQIDKGRYRGKTSIIIYGLKAYIEHSDLIRRERERLLAFERGLQEGAVIEQLIEAQPATTLSARAFEPVIQVGSERAREIYDRLLGGLLELRRSSLREAWDLPLGETERQNNRALREGFLSEGIQLPEGNPLVSVDTFSTSFIYRRRVNDQEQQVKVTRLPSVAEINRELRKAEDAQLVEEARRDAAAGKSAGVVLLNQALEINGRLEVGPLLRNRDGQVLGAGLIGAQNIEDFFALIDRMPVADRARLRFNHFAATVVDLDRNGTVERVFLTIEFPLGEVKREWTNPSSGECEILTFTNGQWRAAVTDRRLVEFDYAAANIEGASRTFANLGTYEAPVRGELIEETRTLDFWSRDLGQHNLDPYQPILSKLRMNYVTGQLARETYGLFSFPIEVADDQYVTQNRYTHYGLFQSGIVFENGQSDADYQRPVADRVRTPIAGRARFRLTCRMPELSSLRDLSASGYQTTIERADLVKDIVKLETFDGANFGRKIMEISVDPFDGTRSFTNYVMSEYQENFQYGLVPRRTLTTNSFFRGPLSQATVIAYDPLLRQLTAAEMDYTGAARTTTWDYRWSNLVESDGPRRRTIQQYNRDETSVTGTTTSKSTGEVVHSFTGQFEATRKAFQVTRLVWYRPGIRMRTETNTYSALGRLITTRIGDTFEVRPEYGNDGIEQSRQTFRRDPGTGRFSIPHRQEDSYVWQNGDRQAQVCEWLEGVPHDEYQMVADAEGRTVQDGIRQLPRLELRTALTYDGESERLLRAEVRQNGGLRESRDAIGEVLQPDGSYRLLVKVIPTWGLVRTNSYVLGDPLSRPVTTEFENRDKVNVVEWFADTSFARVTESTDRHGRLIERRILRPNAGIEADLLYDRVSTFKVSPWGDAGLAKDTAFVQGTDVSLFQEAPDARVYFDLAKPYEVSRWAADKNGQHGLPVIIAGTTRSNVTAVFRSQFRDWRDVGETNRLVERVLEVERTDLAGLFYHKVSRSVLDRAGNPLETRTGKIDNLGPRTYSEEEIFVQAAGGKMARKFSYRYDPGWISERLESATGSKQMIFRSSQPSPQVRNWSVNEAGWREWPTQIRARQAASESQLDSDEPGHYPFRRLHDPRFIQRNPFLPGLTNFWTAWISTELNEEGKPLFDVETISDAQGTVCVSEARKVNSRGEPAVKLAYQLPPPAPESWRALAAAPGSDVLRLAIAGPEDFSPFDFIAFYLEAPRSSPVELRVRDSAGNQASVGNRRVANRSGEISFWPVDREEVQWLPNEFVPQRGSVISAPLNPPGGSRLFALSVPELARL
ncbi:MAG: hypothetical protein ABI651_13000, partial [Verrucomicrobiota bacterium]